MRVKHFTKGFCMILLTVIMLSLCSVSVSANAPVTPDIIIRLDRPYDGDYCVIVLSNIHRFRHYSEWFDGKGYEDQYTKTEQAAIRKLKSSGDQDGYGYIVELDHFNKTDGETYVEYPYDSFKIALYYPDSDLLAKTDVLIKDKYIQVFLLTMDGKRIADVQTARYDQDSHTIGEYQPAVKGYAPYYQERLAVKFVLCLGINLVVEILIALIFGYRKRGHILTIVITNIVTLALLTVSTILINPLRYNGLLSFPFAFFEIAVAAVEGTVYAIAFKRYEYRETYRPWLAVLYAVIANLITYVIGAYLCFLPV